VLGTPLGRPYPDPADTPGPDAPGPGSPAVGSGRVAAAPPGPGDPPTVPIPLPLPVPRSVPVVEPRWDGREDAPWPEREEHTPQPVPARPWPAGPAGPPDLEPPVAPGPDRADAAEPGGSVRPPAHEPGGRPGRLGMLARRWVPEAWRGARLDPGRPGAVALVLVAAVAAVLAAVGVWSGRPQAEPVGGLPAVGIDTAVPSAPPSAQPPLAAATATTPAAPAAELVVSVAGRVRRPGLVSVPDGSRVADVLHAAGGALPGTDLATVNLARRVADGEQVSIGVPAAVDAAPAGPAASGDAAAPASGGKVDLNKATLEQLDGLPGVGPVTAQRILDWRTRSGRFSRVDQLREVEGIGERRFSQLKDLVTV
jgi:competence protein ComEA